MKVKDGFLQMSQLLIIEKDQKIIELVSISKQNEESHSNHYDDMKKKIQEIEEANEELNIKLEKASEMCDVKEKDIKECEDLLKTKDHETCDTINNGKCNSDTKGNNDAMESNRCQPNYCNHDIFENL